MTDGPARLHLPSAPPPSLAAAGWMQGDAPVPAAAVLLAEMARGPDPEGAFHRLGSLLGANPALGRDALSDPALGRALVTLAGATRALSRLGAADPDALRRAVSARPPPPPAPPTGNRRADLAALRRRAAEGLLAVAGGDLTGHLDMPAVGEALSAVADEAAHAALDAAFLCCPGQALPFTVVAMGKWGGRELNYASDVDLLFVYGVPGGESTEEAGSLARRLAEAFLDCLGGPAPDGFSFRVDPGLRPEGRAGPLARTVGSYRAYWERWARPWELQALIKARIAAGDPDLGRSFLEAAAPFVYPETLGPDAVREIRAMKGRTEAAAASRSPQEIKRGVGGIRDVEFAVQLLQLVHGRADPSIRSGNTLQALRALGEAGYVSPGDAASLAEAYAWLRTVEHRLQLADLRRTHRVPDEPAERDRVAKAMGYRDGPAGAAGDRFTADLVERRAAVRAIHQRLFYRPLLEAFAASPATGLTTEGAVRQLAALGFQDADGARRAFEDLTAGLSRRSRLMQQLLPLMMGWLSDAPDPDLGLDQLRLLVTSSEDNTELVAAMRDNPVAAERLCTLLGTSRLLGRLLDRLPPALSRLGSDEALAAFPDRAALAAGAERRLAVRPAWAEVVAGLHRFLEAHLLWVAARDLVGGGDEMEVGRHLSDLADAVVGAALGAASRRAATQGLPPPALAVIAVGTWGGRELNYASDLDALVVYRSTGEASDEASAARRVVESLLEALGPGGPLGGSLALDLALRPEGRQGAAARSLDAYLAYWDRWAEPWERQALLRARHAAGDAELGAEFVAAAAQWVYRPGLSAEEERRVRHLKARGERERIPVHEDPRFHTKLGRGGMADVEWAVQLLQLRHGHGHPGVREPGTLAALAALEEAGLAAAADTEAWRAAYRLCARVRNRLFLQAGRVRDSLPADPAEVTRLARSLGYGANPRAALREDYRRATRRSRRAFERIFFGKEPGA
ncbi:MAG TPA: bifunctional [glutamine synthetase] adenylyltransferase/[glutamine synthetase]-adenylyl-L-tyrosine phosphorylase [Acidimicrobiia bacterium]|nr:bifunctional [glutamine synthetase] adenylyltransferase/[glutamine synthetase]-adenylyl-L-tyrosine phosphorylase [Acidimicrobiia bacterium]